MKPCVIALALLLSACTERPNLPAGASWDPDSGIFQWSAGQVKLPDDMTYSRVENDTFAGNFVSSSGKIVIHHDIGVAAGAWAQNTNARSFEEKIIDGARVWLALRTRGGEGDPEVLAAVTFPDNDCANFFMLSKTPIDISVVRRIAGSFRPKNTAKAAATCQQRDAAPVQ